MGAGVRLRGSVQGDAEVHRRRPIRRLGGSRVRVLLPARVRPRGRRGDRRRPPLRDAARGLVPRSGIRPVLRRSRAHRSRSGLPSTRTKRTHGVRPRVVLGAAPDRRPRSLRGDDRHRERRRRGRHGRPDESGHLDRNRSLIGLALVSRRIDLSTLASRRRGRCRRSASRSTAARRWRCRSCCSRCTTSTSSSSDCSSGVRRPATTAQPSSSPNSSGSCPPPFRSPSCTRRRNSGSTTATTDSRRSVRGRSGTPSSVRRCWPSASPDSPNRCSRSTSDRRSTRPSSRCCCCSPARSGLPSPAPSSRSVRGRRTCVS